MHLNDLMDRCERLEERAAALYRAYAAASRAEPQLCALWTGLAREEDEHARSIARARVRVYQRGVGRLTDLDGWKEAVEDVDRCLAAAEGIGGEATTAAHLAAALALETSELEALRHALLVACAEPAADDSAPHALRFADAAIRLSDDPQVRLRAALLRARVQLRLTA
jgi:hypothetical protein